jgi:hypothetical protein
MSMAYGKDREQVQAWLHESVRLLEDLPASALLPAIDDCVKEPGRVFVPSVGEIRAKADAALQAAQMRAARLNRLRQMIADGVPIPEWQQSQDCGLTPKREPWTPEPGETAAILAEYGIRSGLAEALTGMLEAKDRPSTAQQMAAEGREMQRPTKQTDGWR